MVSYALLGLVFYFIRGFQIKNPPKLSSFSISQSISNGENLLDILSNNQDTNLSLFFQIYVVEIYLAGFSILFFSGILVFNRREAILSFGIFHIFISIASLFLDNLIDQNLIYKLIVFMRLNFIKLLDFDQQFFLEKFIILSLIHI